jgi:nitrate/nitrite transporter NarK
MLIALCPPPPALRQPRPPPSASLLASQETHPYYVLQRMAAVDAKAAAEMQAAAGGAATRPVFQAPWGPLRYLADPAIAPYAVLAFTLFGCMFASIIIMPLALAQPPYNLNEAMIGVAFLAGGIAGLLASPVGGVLADKAHARWEVQARVLPASLAALVFMPAGQLVFGWTLEAQAPLVGPLAGQVLIALGLSMVLPGVFSYISVVKQREAGAAAGAVQATMFVLAGVLILVSAPAVSAIGVGAFQTILAGVCAAAAAGSLAAIALAWRRQQRAAAAAPADADAEAS